MEKIEKGNYVYMDINNLKNKSLCAILIKNVWGDYMIRESVKQEIFNSLNYDIFRFEDFAINEEYSGDIYKMYIKKDEYYFVISIEVSYDEEVNIKIMYSPGDVLKEYSVKIGLSRFNSDIVLNIKKWLLIIKKEMLTPLQSRYFDNTIEAFRDEINSKLESIEDTYFTNVEAEKLKDKLEELEKILADRENDELEKELKKEIAKMKDEINFLKNTISNTKKRKWFKNVLLKTMAWSKNPQNKELIKMGIDGVKAISQIDFHNINK